MNEKYQTLYYECHITTQPVFNEKLVILKSIASKHGFRVANLLVKKSSKEKEITHNLDSFCTTRTSTHDVILYRMKSMIQDIEQHDITVYRYKIEICILDSKITDELDLLHPEIKREKYPKRKI